MTTLSQTLDYTPSWMMPARKPRPSLLDWVKSFWIVQEDFAEHYVVRSWQGRLNIVVLVNPDPSYYEIPDGAWRLWRRLGFELDRYRGQRSPRVRVRYVR